MATHSNSPRNLTDSYSSDSLQAVSPPSEDNNQLDGHSHNRNTINDPHGTVTIYSPPTILGLVRSAAINLVLPFVNGLMLGFGELFAHEIAFRLGWSGTRIFPTRRSTLGGISSRPAVPGVEIRENANETRRREREMDKLTALE